MSTLRPPTIDPVAAGRWGKRLASASPWLHEEVARRMEDRLQWIVQSPNQWVHWEPLRGGTGVHQLLAGRYARSTCFVMEDTQKLGVARSRLLAPWWTLARWRGPPLEFGAPPVPVQMLWANMALHASPDPAALIAQWHQLIATDGFLMFSCFGPDTLRELRRIYTDAGLPPPHHEFTDMHDWGDMLVAAGFAEPVMDMERITLSYSSPQTLLAELRELGRNLHVRRHPALRTPRWRDRLMARMEQELAVPDEGQRLQISFEIVYGHAFKPPPRLKVQPETNISLEEMRSSLRRGTMGVG